MVSTLPLHDSLTDRVRQREADIYQDRLVARDPNVALSPRLIDLFCGAGGMTLGFTARMGHHFDVVWANDFDRSACDTYNANFGHHCTCGDIVDILQDSTWDVPQADLVIGGPPCQGFGCWLLIGCH